jgi:nitroimidazol reductase NimA-like FMN-containing flavoprotein (pyridoxamine 5'-phosphate oxidase superfamily)
LPGRATYAPADLQAILDEALVCHVGFSIEGQPFVIPTLHARAGRTLYLHGSPASRMLRNLRDGVDACVTVTLIDGLVLARSWFHHSVNYRSAVIFGRAQVVEDPDAKLAALRVLVDHVAAGRSNAARPPNAKELAGTSVLSLGLDEASVKIRTGPPLDDAEDYALDVWAGVVPLTLTPAMPLPDPRLTPGIAVPDHVRTWAGPA